MNRTTRRVLKCGVLLQTASFAALAAGPAPAQTAPAAMPEAEQVLVTGSLIHGTQAVGVPVASFNSQDFLDSGSVTTSDLFKDVPSVVTPQSLNEIGSGGTTTQNQGVNIHNLSANNGALRTLMLIDGMRYPGEGNANCMDDPGIINQLAIDHIDLLADGASATYGSDAEAGVLNIILKRGFDGAITQAQIGASTEFGGMTYRASQLFGRTWDSGDVTVSFDTASTRHIIASAVPSATQNFFAANGLDNRDLLVDSIPATISTGKPANAGTAPSGFTATQGTTCGNCYVVPSQGQNTAFTWAAITGNTPLGPSGTTIGTANEKNSWQYGWLTPDIQRNGATLTFDQNIVSGVQLYGDGFYSNRRTTNFPTTGSSSPLQNNVLSSVAVPTFNPYYPAGAPSNILVDYDLILEVPIQQDANELGDHYDFGFNLDLPFKWLGKVYYASTEDQTNIISTGAVNPANVSAALGWTIPASGTGNSFSRPAAVPYLDVFCDPSHFTCNDPATLAYIQGFRNIHEQDIITEYGANFDGPLYALPAGDLKAAVGGTYDTYSYEFEDKENYNNQSLSQITDLIATQWRSVWAVFGQFNVPLVGGDFKLPFVQKLDLEGSIRYDHYSDVGSTTNPKVSATWEVADGLQLKGAWGTAFRAPQAQEQNGITGGLLQGVDLPGASASVNTCPATGTGAVAGSPAHDFDPNCTTGLQNVTGITLSGGASIADAVRHAGNQLSPETAQNISLGWEWAPTDDWFKGLDISATYYFVRIRNKLQGCTNQGLDSALSYSCFFDAANDPTFLTDVQALLNNPKSQLPQGLSATSVTYVFDGATRNIGWQSVNGVDFTASYTLDTGDLGTWNAGVVGNYVIDNKSQLLSGIAPVSLYSTPVNGTRDSGGRLRYRAHLGWNGGPDDAFTVTAFMNYTPHLNLNAGTVTSPPNCFLAGQAACNANGLPQYAQYTMQYPMLNNFVPGMYTFDLQVGYKTGDRPANDYLKNLGITLMVSDLFDRKPPFQYVVTTTANIPHAFASNTSIEQRFILLTVTKAW